MSELMDIRSIEREIKDIKGFEDTHRQFLDSKESLQQQIDELLRQREIVNRRLEEVAPYVQRIKTLRKRLVQLRRERRERLRLERVARKSVAATAPKAEEDKDSKRLKRVEGALRGAGAGHVERAKVVKFPDGTEEKPEKPKKRRAAGKKPVGCRRNMTVRAWPKWIAGLMQLEIMRRGLAGIRMQLPEGYHFFNNSLRISSKDEFYAGNVGLAEQVRAQDIEQEIGDVGYWPDNEQGTMPRLPPTGGTQFYASFLLHDAGAVTMRYVKVPGRGKKEWYFTLSPKWAVMPRSEAANKLRDLEQAWKTKNLADGLDPQKASNIKLSDEATDAIHAPFNIEKDAHLVEKVKESSLRATP